MLSHRYNFIKDPTSNREYLQKIFVENCLVRTGPGHSTNNILACTLSWSELIKSKVGVLEIKYEKNLWSSLREFSVIVIMNIFILLRVLNVIRPHCWLQLQSPLYTDIDIHLPNSMPGLFSTINYNVQYLCNVLMSTLSSVSPAPVSRCSHLPLCARPRPGERRSAVWDSQSGRDTGRVRWDGVSWEIFNTRGNDCHWIK